MTIITFCPKCKSKTGYSGKAKLGKMKNNKYALVGKFNKCVTKNFTFVCTEKLQNTDELISNLIRKPVSVLSKIPLLNLSF